MCDYEVATDQKWISSIYLRTLSITKKIPCLEVLTMSVIANVSVAPADFKLARTLGHHHSVTIEVDRIVPAANEYMPYHWISGLPKEKIQPILERETDVEHVTILDNQNNPVLVEITWTDQNAPFLDTVAAEDGTVVDAAAQDRMWNIALRFPSRMKLQTFYHHCADLDFYPTINRIHNRSILNSEQTVQGLSDEQIETLQIALDAGYFAVPREVTIEELAGELSVSDAAISQRLRRGIRNVLAEILVEERTSH